MEKRLEYVRKLLRENKTKAMLVSSHANISYLTNYSNFSKDEREAFLLITLNEQFIITDGRYSEAVVEKIPHFKLLERTSQKNIETILAELIKKNTIKLLGIEEDNLNVLEYRKISKIVKCKHISLSNLRVIKDQDEIANIKKACQIGDKAYSNVLKNLRIGITEKELAKKLELFIQGQKADISFPPIVAFSKNSSVPHHQTSEKKLNKNEWVLLDFGVIVNNYCSDMTRTVFFGKVNVEQKKMYQTVLEAQQCAIDYLKSKILDNRSIDIRCSSVDRIAREFIVEKGYPTIPHSLGHGIGLEVHERPSLSLHSKDVLEQGMVFSIEPGIYLKGIGGVRIEDLVLLRNNKVELLTKSKRKLIEL